MYNKRSYSKLITYIGRLAGPKADIQVESVNNYYRFTNAEGSKILSSGHTLAESYAWFDGWLTTKEMFTSLENEDKGE